MQISTKQLDVLLYYRRADCRRLTVEFEHDRRLIHISSRTSQTTRISSYSPPHNSISLLCRLYLFIHSFTSSSFIIFIHSTNKRTNKQKKNVGSRKNYQLQQEVVRSRTRSPYARGGYPRLLRPIASSSRFHPCRYVMLYVCICVMLHCVMLCYVVTNN